MARQRVSIQIPVCYTASMKTGGQKVILFQKFAIPRRLIVLFAALLICTIAALALVLRGADKSSPFLERPALPYLPVSEEKLALALVSNPMLPPLRQTVTESAVLLAGKVSYFWGGKSEAVGFDPAWGELKLVESSGSETTGEYLPFGLDCSGYITWCFVQSGMTFGEAERRIGNGSTNQWRRSYEVEWEELFPGDFVFQYRPGNSEGNHVGIVLGFDETGEPVIAHCSYSLGGCVITGRGDVFTYARRPYYYDENP